jgi:hypothetical protein
MSAPTPPEDKRTLVDRALDRIRNNRFAAALIIVGIGVTALGSLTDTLKKLSASMPNLAGSVDATGIWKSDPADFYGAGPQLMILTIKEVVAGKLVGSLRFTDAEGRTKTPDLGIVQGKLEGNKLTFSFDGGVRRYLNSGSPLVAVPEAMTGEVAGNQIRFVYERDGRGAISFVARK